MLISAITNHLNILKIIITSCVMELTRTVTLKTKYVYSVHKIVCAMQRLNLKNILNLNKREVLTFLWFISTAELWPVTSIN